MSAIKGIALRISRTLSASNSRGLESPHMPLQKMQIEPNE
jgi:hypothetical protein